MKVILKRPLIISIICVFGFIGVVYSLPDVFSPFTKRLGMWYPAIFGFIIASVFISLIGVWHMKRWGVELFICSFISDLLLLAAVPELFGVMYFTWILFRVWYIITFIYFYPRMDRNL